jgi:hypothetical protein
MSEDVANATVGAVVGGVLAGPAGLVIGAAAGSLVSEASLEDVQPTDEKKQQSEGDRRTDERKRGHR